MGSAELHDGTDADTARFHHSSVVFTNPHIVRVFTKLVSCIPIFLSPLTRVDLTDILVFLTAGRECGRVCYNVVLC